MLAWDCNLAMDSNPALIYEIWIEHLHNRIVPHGIPSTRLAPDILIKELQSRPDKDALLSSTLVETLAEIRQRLGSDQSEWKWGNLHKAYFHHPLGTAFDLPAHSRPGDGYTVNATGGPEYSQTHGASYREVIDVSDWDRSLTTNTPGESGVPGSRHYGDLITGWADGNYHPLPFSRKAVEAAAEQRLMLVPVE
jgi:penicillin amidase